MWDSPPVLSPNGTAQLKTTFDDISNVVSDFVSSALHELTTIDSPLPKELRKFERYRLDSFKSWPADNGMDPKKLAKAGFFSTRIKDEVVCFSCGGLLQDWKIGDVAIARHKEKFPGCEFISGKSDNIPLNAASCTNIKYRRDKKVPNSNNRIGDNSISVLVNGENSNAAPRAQNPVAAGNSSRPTGRDMLQVRGNAIDRPDGGLRNKFNSYHSK